MQLSVHVLPGERLIALVGIGNLNRYILTASEHVKKYVAIRTKEGLNAVLPKTFCSASSICLDFTNLSS